MTGDDLFIVLNTEQFNYGMPFGIFDTFELAVAFVKEFWISEYGLNDVVIAPVRHSNGDEYWEIKIHDERANYWLTSDAQIHKAKLNQRFEF